MNASRPPSAPRRPVLWPCLLSLALATALEAHAQTADTPDARNGGDSAAQPPANRKAVHLERVDVHGQAIDTYGGGQIARRGSLGVLGEQDLMDF